MKIYIYGLVFNFIMLFTIPTFAGYYSNKIRISPDGNLYLTSYSTDNEWKRITKIINYDSVNKKITWDYTIVDANNCALDSLSVDPRGNKLVYISYCILNNIGASDGSAKAFYRLTVFDIKNRKEIISFKHAFNISFSPLGDAIVYFEKIPGERGSPAPPGYQGGVWIYDFQTKALKCIYNKGSHFSPFDINWSEHDGHIYIQNYGSVYHYDPTTGKGELSKYKGIYFSSNGQYYVSIPFEDRYRIYRTSDNQEMVEMEKQIENYQFIGFAGKMKSAIFWNGKGENFIFDLNQGKIIGNFTGRFMGTNAEGTKFAVRPLGPDKKPQVDKVQILNLLDIVNKSGCPK